MILHLSSLWSLIYQLSVWVQSVFNWLLIDGEPNPFKLWHVLTISLIVFSIGFIGFLIGRKTK